jgi:tRNA pseudouridine38-40 synthase
MSTRYVAPPGEGHVRVRATIAYHGLPFRGFAINPGVRTVQGVLEEALATVLRQPVPVACAGRTDRGVHARGQVISFDAPAAMFEPHALTRAVNRMLRPDVVIRDVAVASDGFDARISCLARSYRYRILNAPSADPLVADLSWHVPDPLNLAVMQQAADAVVGQHQFRSFSKQNRSKPGETFIRNVLHTEWTKRGDLVEFAISANSFTHQMVRSLVGLFVDIGRGRRELDSVGFALAAADRASVPGPAPPHGLVLTRAHYGPSADNSVTEQ